MESGELTLFPFGSGAFTGLAISQILPFTTLYLPTGRDLA